MFGKKLMLIVVALAVLVTPLAGAFAADEHPYMAISIRTLDNEYYHSVIKGARMFLKWVGAPEDKLMILLSEGNSEKQVSDLRSVLAKTGKNAIFYFDPNDSPVAVPLAETCRDAGVYFMTEWNKPANVWPWDYDPYWVIHATLDGQDSGYKTGKALLEAIGGEGKVVAVQGRLANSIAIARFKGFQKALAEYPKVELLDARPADWNRARSQSIVESWLVAYPDLKAVWAANDEMGLGAVEALRAVGKAGKIPVTGIDATGDAVRAVIAKEMTCTVSPDPYWQSGMGLSFAWHAYTGKIKPAEIPKEKRAFYYKSVLVTQENAEKFMAEYVNGTPEYDYTDLWGDKWLGQVRAAE